MQVWQGAIGIGVSFLAGVLIPTGTLLTKIGALVQVVNSLTLRVTSLENQFGDLTKTVYEIKGILTGQKEHA